MRDRQRTGGGSALLAAALLALSTAAGCSSDGAAVDGGAPRRDGGQDGAIPPGGDGRVNPPGGDGRVNPPGGDGRVNPPPAPSCAPASSGGSTQVAAPVLSHSLKDAWHEGWVASVAVVDLDGDGKQELIAPRDTRLVVWNADGSKRFYKDLSTGRIWASAVVGDLLPGKPGLEIAIASRKKAFAWDKDGNDLPGFPVTFKDELRAIAAGDIDGDGQLELVVVTSTVLSQDGKQDLITAYEMDGSTVTGFPPNTSGASGCDKACYVTGGYDQSLALGDVDGDGKLDIFAGQDNAYLSLHDGTGRAFDANPMFKDKTKFTGIRFLHDYALAAQGYADNEQTALQAHFTNSAPAIADVDGDGQTELIILGSVQNASQDNREQGVALWLLHNDGSRLAGWESPHHLKAYLSGLWDLGDTNVVAATNQVSVADLDPAQRGLEMVFAGFDGSIHCVGAANLKLWSYQYTTDKNVLTAGVAVADLSGDGAPEVIFASYSTASNKSALFVLDGKGQQLHRVPLPGRGAMAVPTVADLDGDGTLEIWLSLKDGNEGDALVLGYQVPGSSANCLPWPTGRANLLRSGYIPPK